MKMDEEAQRHIALGLMWFFIFFGIGSCSYMASKGQGNNPKPFFNIETNKEVKAE